LHSYGIAHRDIKLENIMMVDDKDNSELKLVDFGLSKLLGPNETSNEPFGTLVDFNLFNCFYSHMLLLRSYSKSLTVKILIFGVWVSLSTFY
jgi:serine/threonine protein kinase